MKIQIALFFTIALFGIANDLAAQKLIKKMAGDACDCVSDLARDDEDSDPNSLMEQCFELAFNKYEKELRKEYGDDFYDAPTEPAVYDLGVEIGKVLISDCPVFLDLIVAQEKESDENAAALYNKGESLYAEGEYKQAVNEYDKAIQLDPENHEYLNSRGVAYFDQGKYYYAISDFINAIRAKSNFALAYYNLAYSKYNLDDNRGAKEDANTSLLYDEDYCGAYNLLGLIYTDMEETDSAFMAFEKAFLCNSSNALYSFNMGYVKYYEREYEEAVKYFNISIENSYEDFGIYSYLGNCYDAMNDYDEAIKAHTLYISNYSSDYVGFYNRGLAYFNGENYEKAISDFEKAAEMDDSDPDIYYKLAQCYEQTDNQANAGELFNKAIEMNPENAGYYDSRAAFNAASGKFSLAIEDAKSSLRYYPNDCKVYMLMSDWYTKLGDDQNSQACREKGIEMGCEE